MPYGQSAWGQAADVIGGTQQNMNQMALAVARMRYQRAVQEQRIALAMGQQALREHLAASTMDKNNALTAAADSRRMMDDMRRSVDERKATLASQLGGQEFTNRMPRPAGDIETDNLSGPGGAMEQAGMAKVAALAEEIRGLHGTPVDPYALHNVPDSDRAVDFTGKTIVKSNPNAKPFMHNIGNTVLGPPGPDGKPTVLYQAPAADKAFTPDAALRARTSLTFDDLDPTEQQGIKAILSDALKKRHAPAGGPRAPLGGTSASGNAPKTLTDRNGKKWLYKGNMPDPLGLEGGSGDPDENNWEEVDDATP